MTDQVTEERKVTQNEDGSTTIDNPSVDDFRAILTKNNSVIPDEARENRIEDVVKVGEEETKEEVKTEDTSNPEETKEEVKDEVKEEKKEEGQEEVVTEKVDTKEEVVETPKFDFSTINENFKSPEDVKKAMTASEARIKELEEKNKALETANPFEGNEDLAKLFVYGKDNPEELNFMLKLKYGDVNPMDMHKLEYIKEHPERKDDLELVEKLVKHRYAELFEEDPDTESDEYIVAKARFEDDAKAIANKHLGKLNNITLPEREDPAVKAEKTEKLKTDWKPYLDKMLGDDVEYPLTAKNEKGEHEVFHKLKISKELLGKDSEGIATFLANQGEQISEDSIKRIRGSIIEAAKNQLVINEMYSYGKSMYDKGREEVEKKYNGVKESEDASDKTPQNEPKADDLEEWWNSRKKNKRTVLNS